MELTGLHHVTAITAKAPENLSFYTKTLGMRLVKKTVNQDDVSAYHLFYADAKGSPGTDLTFFDWPYVGAHRPGTGDVAATALRVADPAALVWWGERFDQLGIKHGDIDSASGRPSLTFVDHEGQRLRLVASDGGGTPWDGSDVPMAQAIRGHNSVTLTVRKLGPTERTLVEIMGFRRTREYDLVTGDGAHKAVVFETGPGGAGAEVHVVERADLMPTRQGAGGVHHVAFRTANADEQRYWLEKITKAGLPASPQIDRFYFQSIYFREPNGVLFEIATDGPGFAADEDPAHQGEGLALTQYLEPRRAEIERGLKPLA